MASQAYDIIELIDKQPATRLKMSVIFWSSALMLVEGYDMQILGSAAPAIIHEMKVSTAMFSPVFSLSLLGYMAGAILLGTLCDRIGRKRTILLGALSFGVCTLATALVHTLPELIALRFLAGIGLGAAVPATVALNAEFAASNRRATRISLMFIGYTIGGALSGIVASRLLPVAGWPWLFVIGGALPLVIAGAIYLFVPESPRFLLLQPHRHAELLGVMRRLRPDIALDANDHFQAPAGPPPGAPIRQLFADGRQTMTIMLWLAYILNYVTLHSLTSWIPTILTKSGLSASQAALIGSTFLMGGTVGALIIGYLIDRKGIASVAALLLLSVPCIAAIGLVGHNPAYLAMSIALAGCLIQGGQIGLTAIAGTFYPTSIRSTGAGWAMGMGRIGSIIGPAMSGLLISLGLTPAALFSAIAVPVLLGGLCSVLLAIQFARPPRTPSPTVVG